MTDAEIQLLTEARTAKWKLEIYEFAYDAAVRSMNRWRLLIQYSGVAIAIVFLYLRYLSKEDTAAHGLLSNVGTGLSLVVILATIWAAFARWPDQIEKKRELSRSIRDLLSTHRKVTDPRPVDEKGIKDWLATCHDFEEKRKHESATVARYYLMRGFQHVGNLYPASGMKCTICSKEWTSESNRRVWRTFFPFIRCDSCGV